MAWPKPSVTVVTLNRQTVAKIVQGQPDVVKVVVGNQGPPGKQGIPGAAPQPFAFAFGDASPETVFLFDTDYEITDCTLEISTPFNGASPSLKVGTLATPDLFMPTSKNDPSSVGIYSAAPHATILANVPVKLTIVPGAGCTQGAGRVLIEIAPIP